MLTSKDIKYIEERGSNNATVEEQLKHFRHGFPYLQIMQPASVGNGIIGLNDTETNESIRYFDVKISEGTDVLKFVPASGAASRMFKDLLDAKNKLEQGIPPEEVLYHKEVSSFFSNLNKFAFYNTLQKHIPKPVSELSLLEILNLLLVETGMSYSTQPKGLLEFHAYENGEIRTPFDEHCVEGALYAKNKDGKIKLHFTVSPEHLAAFNVQLNSIKTAYEQKFNASYEITFSQQKLSTDTIAVTPENQPFRNADGSLVFRPGGHGALLDNLNDLDADIIFIKNIDNVVPDHLKKVTVNYKKALGGLLLKIQQKIFSYQQIFDTHHYYALDSAFLSEAVSFLENMLNVKPPYDLYYTEKEELYHYLKHKFDRPIRVCGMVKNVGEPGGGPFWAKNSDGSVSLQVVESSQINLKDTEQLHIANKSTHFNPVDLVCAIKNYKGKKYELSRYRDPETGFVSHKSKDGYPLKALELPGLWNGAMADWNTLFVEVPLLTFNPVKTVNDLLRKEHQPK